MEDSSKPVQEKKEWRVLFPSDVLKNAEKAVKNGYVKDLNIADNTATATIAMQNGRRFEVSVDAPKSFYENWNDKRFRCSCLTKKRYYHWLSSGNRYSEVCNHEAAVLMVWEQQHGPWVFDEPPELAEARRLDAEKKQKAKELAKQKKAEEARRKAEEALRQAEKEKKKNHKHAAASFFPGKEPDGIFYKLPYILRHARTNEYAAEQLPALLAKNTAELTGVSEAYSRGGAPMLAVRGSVLDGERRYDVRLELLSDRLESYHCTCSSSYYYFDFSNDLCEHQLALLTALREYIHRENPGDATDRAASSFLEAMDRFSVVQETEPEEETPRPKTISLQPRLALSDGELVLSYKIGHQGGKAALLRGGGQKRQHPLLHRTGQARRVLLPRRAPASAEPLLRSGRRLRFGGGSPSSAGTTLHLPF